MVLRIFFSGSDLLSERIDQGIMRGVGEGTCRVKNAAGSQYLISQDPRIQSASALSFDQSSPFDDKFRCGARVGPLGVPRDVT